MRVRHPMVYRDERLNSDPAQQSRRHDVLFVYGGALGSKVGNWGACKQKVAMEGLTLSKYRESLRAEVSC